MEKKGNRNILPSSRGPASDSKKNQDGVGGKVWPRGAHRREPTNNSLSTKPEPSRKPQPQRIKTMDKRPRPRGTYSTNTGAVGRTPTARLDDQEPELGSIFLPGSKKQSLNHLLNFVYTPRDVCQPDRAHKGANRLIVTKKHKYNKEHFLQANCQFVVNESGDYKQYMTNPDALVDWNLVEQVNLQVSEFPSCPICLYPPVAAKMTRCGHIYCWPCILHYLALSEKTWSKCPICYETVHKQDLKSVVSIPHATFNVNETITFKLMKRTRGCLTAYPSDAEIIDDVIFNMSEKVAGNIYSKLLLANRSDILSIIEKEQKELEWRLAEDGDCSEKSLDEALALLQERRMAVFKDVDDNASPQSVTQSLASLNLETNENSDNGSTVEVEPPHASSNGQPVKFHYFYQASDGQHIYLHAINAQMLEHSYGSLEFGPKTITGKILQKEGGSMTEDIRKRLRYLQHLPVTCQFEVAEIQLKQPIVTKDTIDQFQDQIDTRRKIRQRRAKEEKRREKRITDEENRKMGKFTAPNIQLESHLQFPEFGFEARLRSESESTQPSERSSSPDFTRNFLADNPYSGPSFATMLATEKKRTPVWPDLKTGTSPLEPVKLINVTGAKMKSTVAFRNHCDSDVEPEDYVPVPAYTKSFGDAIAQALQKVEEPNVEDDTPVVMGKKKKKKNKQKVLFTTNMAYSG